MSNTYVPTISSGLSGPFGVQHLPRFWQKVSLAAQGKLAPGYPAIGGGYDSMVINALGLTPEAVTSYISNNKPTYTQFESWVKSQPGVKLDQGTISELNNAINGYIHSDDTRKGIFSASGLSDDSCSYRDAVKLNNLDDWNEFHAAVLK